MIGPELEAKIIQELLPIRDRLHEMEVRRPYTPTEMVGHFCTELRRLYILAPLCDTKLWIEPFVPATSWWPKPVTLSGEETTIARSEMVSICRKVVSMDDDDIVLTKQLDALTKQLPLIVGETTKLERLTRKTTDLITEATAFASQQEHTL